MFFTGVWMWSIFILINFTRQKFHSEIWNIIIINYYYQFSYSLFSCCFLYMCYSIYIHPRVNIAQINNSLYGYRKISVLFGTRTTYYISLWYDYMCVCSCNIGSMAIYMATRRTEKYYDLSFICNNLRLILIKYDFPFHY